jgi:putative tryptophan/tyrosine transport system substrate-binding protein
MRRREFITLLGGAAAAWPLAACAQQSMRVRRIAVLVGWLENDPSYRSQVAAFIQELARLGWSDARNIRIEERWTNADISRARIFAKELVAGQPDVIFAVTTPAAAALQKETSEFLSYLPWSPTQLGLDSS